MIVRLEMKPGTHFEPLEDREEIILQSADYYTKISDIIIIIKNSKTTGTALNQTALNKLVE